MYQIHSFVYAFCCSRKLKIRETKSKRWTGNILITFLGFLNKFLRKNKYGLTFLLENRRKGRVSASFSPGLFYILKIFFLRALKFTVNFMRARLADAYQATTRNGEIS